MRGVARKAGSSGSGQGRRQGFASDSYLRDPHLLPRLEQYSHNNRVSNIDVAVEYLRRNYREYRRKQQGPFRKLVVRAVNILRKRKREAQEDPDEEVDRRLLGSHDDDEILQLREEKHMMRCRAALGRQCDVLEAESLDNSSENSDGVESEGMSEGDGVPEEAKKKPMVRNASRVTGKPAVNNQFRGVAAAKERNGGRREGKEKETSDSEEELAYDEMEEKKPSFNLLNSSLRATYGGRPSLVIRASTAVEKNGLAGSSSSLFKFTSLPKVGCEETRKARGECSRAGMLRPNAREEETGPAFAPPSVVVEAARAASSAKRFRKGPVIDLETREAFGKGSVGAASTDKNLCRESPPAQSSGRLPQSQKLNWQFPSSTHPAPEIAPRLQNCLKSQTDIQVEDGARSLERVESGIGTYESSGQIGVKSRERESGKPNNAKRRKPDNGRPRDGVNGFAPAERAGSSTYAMPRNVSLKDLGGIEGTLEIIRETIEYPLAHPELYEHLGVQPPRGVLLHGPPGCGKTMLANAIAFETRVPFLKISAPEVVSGMSGESEAKVRALFAEAVRLAPCIVFIDEIDAITPKRETAQREMERRIVAQLLTCMDDLSQPLVNKDGTSLGSTKKRSRHVVVIGATNRPDALDPALRRAGRFDREIALGIPDEKARARILSVLAQKLRLEGSFDFKHIAKRTPGFVGADLAALIKEAAAVAIKRIFITRGPRLPLSPDLRGISSTNASQDTSKTIQGSMQNSASCETGNAHLEDPSTVEILKRNTSPEIASVCKDMEIGDDDHEHWKRPWAHNEIQLLSIMMQDFEDAVAKVQPSAKREGFATIPDVTWDDVGSLGPVREELEFSISRPIKHPEEYEAMGLDMATGVLLYGPPGCGKTLVAKAIANDAGANFISIKGPELLNKYVGESERAVRQLFTRARASVPCVLFFDEMDAMAPRRGNDGNGAAERVVNQLLTEMDGLESRKSIFIIAATNRPDMIDPALMRPGRLDKLLYVPLPDPQGRGSIMRTLVRKVPLAPDVDAAVIGESEQCEGFSGADLSSLVREACITSLRERVVTKSMGKSSGLAGVLAVGSGPLVSSDHFNTALTRVFPSVSSQDRLRYDNLCKKLQCTRGSIEGLDAETEDAEPPAFQC